MTDEPSDAVARRVSRAARFQELASALGAGPERDDTTAFGLEDDDRPGPAECPEQD